MKEKRRVKKHNNWSNQQKSNFAQKNTLFCTLLCSCFARLQRETSRNLLIILFVWEMSYVFLFIFFSLPLIFTLVSASISYFPTAATKFSCCFSNNRMPPLFFAGLSPTFCFSLSLSSLYSKFVDMTIKLSLIPQTTLIQKKFDPFIDSLVVSASQDAGGFAISAKRTSSCHTCMLIGLFYIGMPVVGTDGQAGGVQSRDYQISRMHRLPNFLTHGAPLRARELC